MGAFDAELYALGYRTVSSTSSTPARKSNDDFVGPHWSGKCVGHCSATVCYPCSFNNRRTEAELIKIYERHDKWRRFDLERFPQLEERILKEDRHFISLYPGYIEYKQALESNHDNE